MSKAHTLTINWYATNSVIRDKSVQVIKNVKTFQKARDIVERLNKKNIKSAFWTDNFNNTNPAASREYYIGI